MCDVFIISLLVISSAVTALGKTPNNNIEPCNLPASLKKEIRGYEDVAKKIIDVFTIGELKGSTYQSLADFIDIFGNRISGSKNLENAIDYMGNISRAKNLENVHFQDVEVPNWIRGEESAEMIQPYYRKLKLLSLGGSVATPPEGLYEEALVVSSFDELYQRKTKVKGKIVVFNEKYINYGKSVKYRQFGASKAAKLGAVGVLIRSITPFSLSTPHTGWQDYQDGILKIPTACISPEDAHMLKRTQDRGHKIMINLKINTKNLAPKTSRNTFVEIRGNSRPEKSVIVSGHLDSWDVGTGAMDDGGGVFISWNALVGLKLLGLRPRRTLKAIFWTGEEEGLIGAFTYLKSLKSSLKNIDFIMESDEGTFNPLGMNYAGPHYGVCVLQEVLKLLEPVNATQIEWDSFVGSDITIFGEAGIPSGSLLNENERYFWYHHSEGDRMDIEDPDVLDKCTAVWAFTAYVMADLSVTIPKNLTVV